MSTLAQLQKIARPFLDAHPEARLLGSQIFLRPVHHVAWTLTLQTSSADTFQLHFGPTALFTLDPHLWPIRRLIYPEGVVWRTSMENVADRVLYAIEAQCLPHVPGTPAIEDLGAFDLQRDNWEVPAFDETYPFWAVCYWAALGDLARARDISLRMIAPFAPYLRMNTRSDFFKVKRDLMPLLFAGDRAGIAALLLQREAAYVRENKLEAVWSPSPFPLERVASGMPTPTLPAATGV